jgi:predicted amidohydrolase YtcJ
MQVYSAINDPDEKFMRAGLNEWLPRMSAYGITAALDAGIQGMGQDEGFQMYLELEKQGVLPLRVIGSYYWNDPAIDPLPILVELNKKYNTELVKAERLKINLDGGDDKHNALFVDPYTDKPDIKVQPIIPYDILNKVVTRADAQGIDVYCHCFGDLAVRKLLDAVEGAIKVNPDRARHHTISHMILVHKDDVPRFAKLGVIPDVQAGWGALDPHVSTISMRTLGKARIDRYLGIKELMDAGAAVSLSSDWPAAGYLSNLNPLVTIQIAVTRQSIGKPDMPRLGGKKAMVPLAAALRAHTLGGANVLAMADQIGSIETGKFADLIVLERNLFDVKPHDIHKTKVQMTMMNGKIVHNAESGN